MSINVLSNDLKGANFTHRAVLENKLMIEFEKFLDEKGFDYLETLERYVVGDNIIFYKSMIRQMQDKSFKKLKLKDRITRIREFAETCSNYELIYYYICSIETVLPTQYELNEDLVDEGLDYAVSTVKAYTLLANIALVCLTLKHHLFEAEICGLKYDKEAVEFEVLTRPAKCHIIGNRFDLPCLVSQESLDESVTMTSEENIANSVVEVAVKFSQNLYLMAVYGDAWGKLFTDRAYSAEQEVFIGADAFRFAEKEIPKMGAYIVTEGSKDIHSIYIRESQFEGMRHIDLCINYKNDVTSNMSISNWRDTHNMAQGINPIEPLKYLNQYLGTEDFGLEYKVIEDVVSEL